MEYGMAIAFWGFGKCIGVAHGRRSQILWCVIRRYSTLQTIIIDVVDKV
ncbi:hypothetical protein [Aphanizomenon sp. UHCC 0183]|nr:hypothetical protein [Aphanizomenon sp. UHCC 0183]